METAVEGGEDVGGVFEEFGEGSDGPDDEGDGHGGLEAFARHVSEQEEG